MAKDSDNLAGDLGADSTGGLFTGLIAEENEFDRRTLWRLGSWGFAAVGAVTLAVLANQSSLGWRRDQLAATEVARHAQQIQVLARESQNEARRLASAIETLNSDRDRLYARVTSLEQGLDTATGAIAKQDKATAPQSSPSPALQPSWLPPMPIMAPVTVAVPAVPAAPEKPVSDKPPSIVAETPPPALEKASGVAAESVPAAVPPSGHPEPAKAETLPKIAPAAQVMIGPPDPAADKPVEPAKPAAASPAAEAVAAAPAATVPDGGEDKKDDAAPQKTEVQRTEFGVDLGGANSVAGLRALWRGLLKSRANAPLFSLSPIIVIREGTGGLGMQLRLVAGPLRDAGAAARICAVMAENKRPCETAIFDGQRLTLKDEPPAATSAPTKPVPHRRAAPLPLPPLPKRTAATPEPEEPPKKPESPTVSAVSALSSLFGRKEQ